MDIPLDRTTRWRRTARRSAVPAAALTSMAALLAVLPGWVAPSLDRARIRTARVEVGPVEATITASGTVVPQFERVIASPIASRVVRILETPGAVLRPGQPIVELDLSESALAVARLGEQLALKANQQEQLRLDLARRLQELGTRRRLQQLQLENLRARTAQSRALVDLGAASQEQLREAQLVEARAGIEGEQIDEEMASSRAATAAQLEGLKLERGILARDREEARRRLDLARIEADRDGVLTWVVEREGASVGPGEVVARLADLSSFRVEATVSDVHRDRVRPGMPVKVRAGEDQYCGGHIARILPTVDNGAMTLDVSLDETAHAALRANQRVDVYIATERRERALRLPRGPFLNGGNGDFEVFAIEGDRAVRRRVRIGISSFEAFEVVDGLQEGEEVVVSDIGDHMHRDEIEVRDTRGER